MVELLRLEPALVLLVEVAKVLEVLLREDLQELVVYGVRVAQRLDAGDAPEVLEEVVRVGEEDGAERADGQGLGLLRRDLLLVVRVERPEGLEEIPVAFPVEPRERGATVSTGSISGS
ncbi:hypothetical protein IMZ48_17330 [Candidatus Bathyarchaeota archaeon]|nr:hypothetical protein [Candidatus Bathyarchaeota archaeon]